MGEAVKGTVLGVSCSNIEFQKFTLGQDVTGVVGNSVNDTTLTDINDSDKYDLEIQTKVKKMPNPGSQRCHRK